jgi:hypothetical protein
MTRGFIGGEYQDGELRGLALLVGRRGTGKTTEMNRLLGLCTGGYAFFDTLSKHAGKFPGYVIVNRPDQLEAYLRANRGRRFHILYQPRGGDLDKHFADFLVICTAFGWMIVAVDEVDKLCGPRFGDQRMPRALYELVNYGRHHQISMIFTARRPQGVPAGIRAEAELRIFRVKAGKESEVFTDEIGEEQVSRLATIPKFCYLHCVEDADPILRGGPRGTL